MNHLDAARARIADGDTQEAIGHALIAIAERMQGQPEEDPDEKSKTPAQMGPSEHK